MGAIKVVLSFIILIFKSVPFEFPLGETYALNKSAQWLFIKFTPTCSAFKAAPV